MLCLNENLHGVQMRTQTLIRMTTLTKTLFKGYLAQFEAKLSLAKLKNLRRVLSVTQLDIPCTQHCQRTILPPLTHL